MRISDSSYSLGFSPCPNDTFIFHALVQGALEECPVFAPIHLEDVETLNEWAMAGRLEVTKLSFHAYGHVMDQYMLLSAGSALGRGCGPLLVSRQQRGMDELSSATIAIPGRFTTAALLLKLFAPQCVDLVVMRFEEIMPAIAHGTVDAGVIIHESRFTYPQHGLVLLQDLGAWWETETGQPIPLGAIAAKRSLGEEAIRRIEQCVRASLRQARRQPAAAMPYIRQHAQELDDVVMQSHISLYVNSFTDHLGPEGAAAVGELLRRGRQAGALPLLPELPLFCPGSIR